MIDSERTQSVVPPPSAVVDPSFDGIVIGLAAGIQRSLLTLSLRMRFH